MAACSRVMAGVLALLVRLGQSTRVPGSATSRPEETCVWSPFGKSRKVYHFQLVNGDGQNIALRFIRDPERPSFDIRMGASWAAWMQAPWFNDDESSVEVQFAPFDDTGRNSTPPSGILTDDGFESVDILSQWRYVRRLRLGAGPDGVLRPNGIEIGLINHTGISYSWAGGAYYPDDLSARSLWGVVKSHLAEEPAPNPTMPAVMHGRGRPRDDGPAPPGRGSMFGVRAADLPQIATSLQSAADPLFDSITSGVSINVFDITSSFSPFGVVISSVTSLTSLNRRWDDLWQMDLVASEKLFDKLWCSGIFTRCPGPDDVIVPPGFECPSEFAA